MTAGSSQPSESGKTEPTHRVFWADEYADRIEDREPAEPIVIKGAVSPSGIPHIGHFNEIMRGYYVAEALRERGYEVTQVFTSDDRDALRKLPRRLADANWNIVELGDIDAAVLGRNLGVPYTEIPDPFGACHESYGDHFTDLLRESAEMVGVPIDVISITDLYESGEFDTVVTTILEKEGLAREILQEYQASVTEDYVPFMPNCSECGKQLTTAVTSIDIDSGTVSYECRPTDTNNHAIKGCGNQDTASFRDGKLPWRFEWPAGWNVLEVDFEPFGKDHAEGSWPSGKAIARQILDFEPPIPMMYEWFTLNGEALSSSSGNVVTVPEVLEVIEPEVLKYFFVKNPRKQRDLDLSRIDRLVDEFDRFEAQYYDEHDGSRDDCRLADRAYPLVMAGVKSPLIADIGSNSTDMPVSAEPSPGRPYDSERERQFLDSEFKDRVRLPYTFAAVLGMTDDTDLRLSMAERAGHIPDEAPEWVVTDALARVERARRWAERMNNEYNYRIQSELPETSFDSRVEVALTDLADTITSSADGDEIQAVVYETAEAHGIEAGDLFSAAYQLFFGRPRGPRLGPFLAALDYEFVISRLRREA